MKGAVPAHELGLVLPHEHMFNDLSSVVTSPSYKFSRESVESKVSPSIQWTLKQDPYCCIDNVAPKPVEDVIQEVRLFQQAGGGTIVDATGTSKIGRSPSRLLEVSHATGLHVVMSTGPYLEKFEQEDITHRTAEQIAESILGELRNGVDGVRAGMIGEIGVSPDFTAGEKNALRGASLAQLEEPGVAMNIHMPGWQRRGDEVLDIVLGDHGVDPKKVALAHSDPSGADHEYQRRLLRRGVWLEFDMIGLDITFPGEGISPSISQTADAVAALVANGYGDQILVSHDLFLKQMWAMNGGNGFQVVPTVFLELLVQRGVAEDQARALVTVNPQRYLGSGTP
ncbi:hypothetical protein QP589_06185 [Helcobacillus massiliensis]|nr:hypothetical protein [Helcobacillus massiliensis]MDK7742152.1 hypothetical protein [Helcobacillus massiliensis]